MKSKSILAIVATILAIVLAVFFPNLKSASTGETTPAASQTAPRANESATTPEKLDPSSATTKKSIAKGAVDDLASKTASAPNGAGAARPDAKPAPDAGAKAPSRDEAAAKSNVRRDIGFGSRQAFDDHFAKHGSEFGGITQAQYLALAQDLRDAPVGGNVLEIVRDDGVVSRFDKKSGSFLAFNKNRTIRTFFKPNDGVRYFERQAEKDH